MNVQLYQMYNVINRNIAKKGEWQHFSAPTLYICFTDGT